MIRDALQYILGRTRSRGMILLFAVLLGGSALLVASGVFTLIFSQVQINQSVQGSYQAYYNADMVMECMRFYFKRANDPLTPTRNFWNSGDKLNPLEDVLCLTGNSANCKVECAGVMTAIHHTALAPGIVDGNGTIARDTDNLTFTDSSGDHVLNRDISCYKFDLNQNNLCAHVEIDHRFVCGAPPCTFGTAFEERTEIHVFGRNTCAQGVHQVQRELEFTQCGDTAGDTCHIDPNLFCSSTDLVP